MRLALDVKQKPLILSVVLPMIIIIIIMIKKQNKKVEAVSDLILLSVLRRLLSLWPKPASELWYRVLLLFL